MSTLAAHFNGSPSAAPLPRSTLLPRPGPLWGLYPMRGEDAPTAGSAPSAGLLACAPGAALLQARRSARAALSAGRAYAALDAPAREQALAQLRRRLRREGLQGLALAQGLGVAAATAERTLGLAARPSQCLAAAVLLGQHCAEMATGEGKTLALALAAAVAGLAGVPVHVATANAYLAERDAAALAPLYAALGLRVAALPEHGALPAPEARRAVYAHDIVYATARDLAFDFLRDSLAGDPADRAAALVEALEGQGGAGATTTGPVMRGLNFALLDEMDSLLLDEAEVPLVLSRPAPQAAQRAWHWQALALARQLQAGRDFTLQAAERSVSLTAERDVSLTVVGEERLAVLGASLGGPWQRARQRSDAIRTALVGLHLCERNRHYLVRDGAIELLDEVSGRSARGREWSLGLHAVVALKEGLAPPPDTDTVAQIGFQRFFQRYWRVAGLSGTLHEARAELQALFGTPLLRVPLHQPSRLRMLPGRVFADAPTRWQAVCERVAALQRAGRPVLIGTDSVADSRALSHCLRAAHIRHQVLDALNDRDEAAIVAQAGRSGCITVATRMAGRGTDIALDAAALAAGGLHVLSCQANPTRRIDRQLAGRAARQGQPGSAELWLLAEAAALDAPLMDSGPEAESKATWTAPRMNGPAWWVHLNWRRWQAREDKRRAARRAELLRQDRTWSARLAFAGAAP